MPISCMDDALCDVLFPSSAIPPPRISNSDPKLEKVVEGVHAMLGQVLKRRPSRVGHGIHPWMKSFSHRNKLCRRLCRPAGKQGQRMKGSWTSPFVYGRPSSSHCLVSQPSTSSRKVKAQLAKPNAEISLPAEYLPTKSLSPELLQSF